MTTTRPPAGLHVSGKVLWQSITGTYELDAHELALLVEAARTCDALDALDPAVRRDGTVGRMGTASRPRRGQAVAHHADEARRVAADPRRRA